ncbi:hypothetical protein Tco_0315973 [Tanacetum coccineum]
MVDLTFADSHNMVAYLEKSEDNADFAEIVDFLNASPIRYALTVSPTVYVSYIEQFWSTAKIKTVNNETQIRAKVDGKTIVITESSVRRDLHFNDEDGITCLTNTEIFENLQLMGSKSTAWNEFGTNIASAVICLAKKQKFNFSKLIFDAVFNDEYDTPSHTKKVFANMRKQGKVFSGTVTPLFATMLIQSQAVEGGEPIPIVASSSQPKKTQKHRTTKRKATKISQFSRPTTLVAVETVHEKMGDIMERAATTATSLDAEQDNGSGPRRQDTILGDRPAQTRFESLSKQSNDPPLLRFNILGSREDIRIESSAEKSLGAQEDASKQGRNEIDQDEGISWFQEDAETQGRYGHDIEINTASTSITTASINITTAEPVTTASAPITTAGVSVSTAEPSTPPTTTILIEDEDLTIAQTLMKMRSVKSKEKSKEKGVSSETATTTTRGVTMQEPSESGTRKIVPPPQHDPKDKGKAKMIKPEKPLKKKDQIKFDEEMAKRLAEELQAELEEERADYELAQSLQAEEQRELTIEERSELFVKLMDKRKKHFAKLRAKEIIRKPPTKAQKRNQMCTYLKNMANYKHSQLKNKSFEEIQMLFDNTIKWVDSFVPMDSKVVKGSKIQAEGSKKRTRKELDEESVKRQNLEDDAEKAEFKACLEIVLDDDSAVNVESLAIKYPITFSAMLDDFDRQDVLDQYRLVKERFETTSLEGYDRLIWGDLLTLFEPIHLLLMDTRITIHMMLEKKYPITQEMLSRMLSGKLEVDHECEMSYELLRFIKSQYKK